MLAPEEAFAEVMKVKGFLKSGGITVSGGEPLLQAEFVTGLFKLCKQEGIHTAIDTSGFVLNSRVKETLRYTDLVLLDVKHIHPEKYKILTSVPLQPTLNFIDYLSEIQKPVWVRYVLVPGFSDDENDLHNWAKYMSQFDIAHIVQRVDVLPFHQMGMHKWEQLGREYKLKDVPTPTKEQVQKAEKIFRAYGLKA